MEFITILDNKMCKSERDGGKENETRTKPACDESKTDRISVQKKINEIYIFYGYMLD